jgi:uncharacterized protein YdeI (YjbR/CyaY-like superfamily)
MTMKFLQTDPIFFENQTELRKWFEENHEKTNELWVGYFKIHSGKPSLTWSESVDQALCFGWIDGIRKSIDESRYVIRFTPRKAKSIWSLININKVEKLKKLGLIKPAGLAIYEKREHKNSGIYSFEKEPIQLDIEYEKEFHKNKTAWNYFNSQVPSYKKPAIYWVMSAKQETTRLKRLAILISDSGDGIKIKPLRPVLRIPNDK